MNSEPVCLPDPAPTRISGKERHPMWKDKSHSSHSKTTSHMPKGGLAASYKAVLQFSAKPRPNGDSAMQYPPLQSTHLRSAIRTKCTCSLDQFRLQTPTWLRGPTLLAHLPSENVVMSSSFVPQLSDSWPHIFSTRPIGLSADLSYRNAATAPDGSDEQIYCIPCIK